MIISKKTIRNVAVAAACFAVFAAGPAPAADWGSLKGRFVVDGKAPEPPPLAVDNKDPFCLKTMPKNLAVVEGKDGGLANVIVYLRVARGQKVEVHPDYAEQLKKEVTLDNHGCSFEPHVTLVRVGQALNIHNSDPTGHNTNIQAFSFNQVIPANGGQTQIKASKESPLPQPVSCNIHPFMKGYLLALDHPYMATSGEDGTFEIKNIPAGKHEFQFWHEAPAYLKDVKLKAGTTNKQGRLELIIEPNLTNDLGDIKIPASMLKVK